MVVFVQNAEKLLGLWCQNERVNFNGKGDSTSMGLLSNYTPKPETSEVSTAEIIDFYSRYGDKKTTATRYCLTVKELNEILKTVKSKTGKTQSRNEQR